jgi:hypothetical protein
MKTTIEWGDSLLAEAKRVAAEQNTTLRAGRGRTDRGDR